MAGENVYKITIGAKLTTSKAQLSKDLSNIQSWLETKKLKISFKLDNASIKAELAKALKGQRVTIDLGNGKSMKGVVGSTKDLEAALKRSEKAAKASKSALDSMKKSANTSSATSTQNDLSKALNNTAASAQNAGKQGAAMGNQFAAGAKGAMSASQAYQAMWKSISSFQSKMQTLRSLVGTFTMITSAAKNFVQPIIEIDSAMAQLEIVTGASASRLEEYKGRISEISDSTAGSIKDIIGSTTTYARLGYSLDESSELARLTQMLQNVGDIDAGSAQNAITAIVKAFDIKSTDLESVMDKLVEVGNNFPISVSELAEGMNNAGSMLSASGNGLEESLALLTAANTTVKLCRAMW